MSATSKIIDGKALAQHTLTHLSAEIARVRESRPGLRAPGLCTVLVGEHPASELYVRNKRKRAQEIGIQSFHRQLDATISQADLLSVIHTLNHDSNVDGILVQLPLPSHIDAFTVVSAVDPRKDVDGFHPENVGLLTLGMPRFTPCTPLACLRLLEKTRVPLRGKHAVVVGRSNVVGKPTAQLLLDADATVTICHHLTHDLEELTRQAEILIVATGVPNLISRKHLRKNAVVIDVGISRLPDGTIVGDVNTREALAQVAAITPVPGGVGPMTIAMLLENTVVAYKSHLGH